MFLNCSLTLVMYWVSEMSASPVSSLFSNSLNTSVCQWASTYTPSCCAKLVVMLFLRPMSLSKRYLILSTQVSQSGGCS
jgi:hypothetical protein